MARYWIAADAFFRIQPSGNWTVITSCGAPRPSGSSSGANEVATWSDWLSECYRTGYGSTPEVLICRRVTIAVLTDSARSQLVGVAYDRAFQAARTSKNDKGRR